MSVEEPKKDDAKVNNLGSGFAIGLMAGTVIGLITGNIGLWLPLGLVFGLLFGSRKPKSKTDD